MDHPQVGQLGMTGSFGVFSASGDGQKTAKSGHRGSTKAGAVYSDSGLLSVMRLRKTLHWQGRTIDTALNQDLHDASSIK